MLVERVEDGSLAACFRYMLISVGTDLERSYSAQFYELSPLRAFAAPMLEIGRFCADPGCRDMDVLRVAWGAMARVVQKRSAGLLFGCSSFEGTDARRYHDVFAVLRDNHIAPARWLPRIKAPGAFEFARGLSSKADPRAAMRAMPPLLKTYLAMGGWVSDHAVIDRDLGTLHVFTGVEVGAIPYARRRSILMGA
jgi:putative hemolysin